MSGALLAAILRDPDRAGRLDAAGWSAIITAARAERLIGSLAHRLAGQGVPERVDAILADARLDAQRERRVTLWEIERLMATLSPLALPVVLLKGSAFVAAGLSAGDGRAVGDLDILVPRERLDEVEAALVAAGWIWVKDDPYDHAYYREWMHELPPLVHPDRERMLDVHHTILPLTARPRPDAGALVAASHLLPSGARVLSPEAMVIHAACHLLADGDLAGGLRNLWDIDRLCRQFVDQRADFYPKLMDEAAHHQLAPAVRRALRLSARIFGTPVPADRTPIALSVEPVPTDRLFVSRILARDGWGRETRPLLRSAFYLRSHALRMPPLMLARHLWTKWRMGHRPVD